MHFINNQHTFNAPSHRRSFQRRNDSKAQIRPGQNVGRWTSMRTPESSPSSTATPSSIYSPTLHSLRASSHALFCEHPHAHRDARVSWDFIPQKFQEAAKPLLFVFFFLFHIENHDATPARDALFLQQLAARN